MDRSELSDHALLAQSQFSFLQHGLVDGFLMTFVGLGPAACHARLPALSTFLQLLALLQLSDFSVVFILTILLVLDGFAFKGEAIVGDEVNRCCDLTQQVLCLLLPLPPTARGADALHLLAAVLLNLLQAYPEPSHQHFHLPHVHLRLLIVFLRFSRAYFRQLLDAPESIGVDFG